MSYLSSTTTRWQAKALQGLVVTATFGIPFMLCAVDRFWDIVEMRPGTGGSGCSVITTYREAWYVNDRSITVGEPGRRRRTLAVRMIVHVENLLSERVLAF